MNPFEDIESHDIVKNNMKIEIWVETYGRKKNTYVSGWNLPEAELKEQLKIIKKKTCCNGTIKDLDNVITDTKTKVVQLQGDHSEYIKEYLLTLGINMDDIRTKG